MWRTVFLSVMGLTLSISPALAHRGRVIVNPFGGVRALSPHTIVVRPRGRHGVVRHGRVVTIGGRLSRFVVSPSRFSFFSLSFGTPFVTPFVTSPFWLTPPVVVAPPFVTTSPFILVPSVPLIIGVPGTTWGVDGVDPLVRREPIVPERRENGPALPPPAAPAWVEDLRVEPVDAHRLRLTWTGATRGVVRVEFFTADAQQKEFTKRILTAPPFDATLWFDDAPAVVGVTVVYNDGVTMTLSVPYTVVQP